MSDRETVRPTGVVEMSGSERVVRNGEGKGMIYGDGTWFHVKRSLVSKLGFGYTRVEWNHRKGTTSNWTHPVHLLNQQILPIHPPFDCGHVPSVPSDQRISCIPDIFLEDEHLSVPAW